MRKIQILWVDDKFQDSNDTFTKRVKEDIDESQDQYNRIDVDMVSNRQDFLKFLATADKKYAAIILDAETADSNNDSPDIKTFDLHLRPVDKLNYNVMKYVYSSYPDQVKQMAIEYGFVIKDKTDVEPYDLLVEIKDSIESEFPVVPELIMSLREGFISASNEKYMRRIIQSYYDVSETPLEDMRYILENIFKHLISLRLINLKALSDPNSLKVQVDYLVYGGTIDGTKNYIPYWVCPMEVRYAIQCLEPCTQLYHHDYDKMYQRMDSSIFTSQYEQFFKEMAYNAFFITMRWYYHFMYNEKVSPSHGDFTNKKKKYY